MAAPVGRIEGVLDGVLDQLGDHHDQGGGTVGVEHAQGAHPADPDRGVHPRDIVHDRQDPVDHLVEIDLLVDRHRQRLVHLGDRGHPSHRFDQRVTGLDVIGAARLQSQQRRHRLQVVLHPVMDLPDRRVLGQQRAIAPFDLGDVADQQGRTRRDAVLHQRQGADQHGRAAGIDLQAHTRPSRQRVGDMSGQFVALERVGDQGPGDRDQVVALQLRGQAHTVIGRQRVGAGIGHRTLDVEPDETIADPRARPRHGQITHVGERALGQHVQQVTRAVQVGLLQPRRGAPTVARGLVGQQGHHLTAVAHRNGTQQTLLGHLGADRVGDQQRGGGGGPALRDADNRAVIAAYPHQKVAEGQIGQQLPLAHHGVQMIDRGPGQHGVLGEQVTES